MGKWEKLCRSLKPLLGSKKDVPESVFEETFVMALEDIFGWDKSSIEQQTQFAIGSAGQLRCDRQDLI